MQYAIEARRVTKRFGEITANCGVDLRVHRGEIHAIVGENGAGKSTLMNILYGLVQPDEGIIYVNGRQADIRRPADALRLGVGMVHQHMMQVPSYSVVENVILGAEPRTRWGTTDLKRGEAKIKELSARFGLHVDPWLNVRDLPVGLKQRVEILKLLYRGAEIIILDEPTAALSPQGTEELLQAMRSLNQQGKTILFISHKLPEVLAVSDHITVMRRGQVVAELASGEADEADLVRLMIGDVALDERPRPETGRGGDVVLAAQNLRVRERGGREAVKGASFQLRAGEIAAVAGVEGNGQSELASALIGFLPVEAGRVWLRGQDVTQLPILQRREMGMAFVPEDRIEAGFAVKASICENAVLGLHYRRKPVSRGWLVDWKAAEAFTTGLAERYGIRLPGSPRSTPVASLSGGNMQKLLLARELAEDSPCLIVAQPTRGMDIGARQFVHEALFARRQAGAAILVISTDLDEVFELADRILVMYKGEIVADLARDETSPSEVGLYMTGAKRAAE